MFNNYSITLRITTLLLSSVPLTHVLANNYIDPPMVNVPAGTFLMGNQFGNDIAKPAHSVTLPAFQIGKYPVTVAEFRKFAEDTGFSPSPSCNDYIGESWFNSSEDSSGCQASWDNHRFQNSEYQPVTCITWSEANEYAQWLSEETGIQYRLPTEQEFEYALKANTTSRYFWGDDDNMTDACLYGNFADKSGEHIPNVEYGASYVGLLGYANCDDGEAYNSIVGLYRPNPFGLYDMVGNVSQYLSTCYYDSYSSRSEAELDNTQCDYVAHRGDTWHFPPQSHASRGKAKRLDQTEWALMGFRLATDGHSVSTRESKTQFEQQLKIAQRQHISAKQQLLAAPKNVHLMTGANAELRLHWQLSSDNRVTRYDVYQSIVPNAHLLGGFYKNHYKKIASRERLTSSLQVNSPVNGGSFRVVSIGSEQSSLPSEPAIIKKPIINKIPGRLGMQNVLELQNVHLDRRDATNDKPEVYVLSRFHTGYTQPAVSATFKVNVEKASWYTLNYRGSAIQEAEFFKIGSNNTLIGAIEYDREIDDQQSNRHKVYLEKGIQNLEFNLMREGLEYWSLTWLEFVEDSH